MTLSPWMFIGQPFDVFGIEGIEEILECLLKIGIQDILLGRPFFIHPAEPEEEALIYPRPRDLRPSIQAHYAGKGLRAKWVPAFPPNSALYTETKLRPPQMPKAVEGQARMLSDVVERAKAEGMGVYLYSPDAHPTPANGDVSTQEISLIEGALVKPCFNDPDYLAYTLARIQDALEHYPQADGVVMDIPEFGYELDHSEWSGIFKCFCPHCQKKAEEWGYGFEAIKGAAERLLDRLHNLQSQELREFIELQTGLFDWSDWLLGEPGLVQWLQFKTDAVTSFVAAMYRQVKERHERLLFGIGHRTAAFAPLTGHNLRRISRVTDFQCPKLYIWLRGIDGLYGTVDRYVKVLMEWNPELDEELGLQFVCKLFGFTLPQVNSLSDLERGFPEPFFTETIGAEIRKAIQRIGDVERIRPWIGLDAHGGKPLTLGEFRLLLRELERAALRSFIFHVYNYTSDEAFSVIQEFTAGR